MADPGHPTAMFHLLQSVLKDARQMNATEEQLHWMEEVLPLILDAANQINLNVQPLTVVVGFPVFPRSTHDFGMIARLMRNTILEHTQSVIAYRAQVINPSMSATPAAAAPTSAPNTSATPPAAEPMATPATPAATNEWEAVNANVDATVHGPIHFKRYINKLLEEASAANRASPQRTGKTRGPRGGRAIKEANAFGAVAREKLDEGYRYEQCIRQGVEEADARVISKRKGPPGAAIAAALARQRAVIAQSAVPNPYIVAASTAPNAMTGPSPTVAAPTAPNATTGLSPTVAAPNTSNATTGREASAGLANTTTSEASTSVASTVLALLALHFTEGDDSLSRESKPAKSP